MIETIIKFKNYKMFCTTKLLKNEKEVSNVLGGGGFHVYHVSEEMDLVPSKSVSVITFAERGLTYSHSYTPPPTLQHPPTTPSQDLIYSPI